jgi:hypothetical protein
MLNLIPTKIHGILDYMTAGLLVTLPRALGWGKTPTRLLDVAAGGAVAYSLVTDYELGVYRKLPMNGHLLLDGMSGAALLVSAAYFLEDEEPEVRGTIAALGAFEVAAALFSCSRPGYQRAPGQSCQAPGASVRRALKHMPTVNEPGVVRTATQVVRAGDGI